MSKDDLLPKVGKVTIACILSTALAVPMASPAHADTIEDLQQEENAARDAAAAAQQRAEDAQQQQSALQEEVKKAQQQLELLGQQAELAENELITITNQLNETIAHIEELDKQIEETKAELAESKEELAGIVSDTYKNGRPTLLSVALNATSFDDLVSRIQYANKVAEYETSVVQRVKDLEAKLEQEKAELEEQKQLEEEQQAEKEQALAQAEAAIAAVESYQAQLSTEIQQKIAEADEAMRTAAAESARADAAKAQRLAEEEARRKAEEEARRKAAEEEARRQQEEAARQNGFTGGSDSTSTSTSTSTGTYSDDDEGESGGGYTVAAGDVNSFVAAAYSIIGSGYSWSGYNWTGSPSSSWFTCSGVIDYALGLPPRSNSPETLYAQVGSRMVYDTSQLQYGDLVFYACLGRSPGHVGIYVGNGQVLDSIPSGGVAIRDVNYMSTMGGGPIF